MLAVAGRESIPRISTTPGAAALGHEGFASDQFIYEAGENACDETTDVGPIGNAGVPSAELAEALEELKDEPESEDEDGGHVDGHDE